MLRFSFSLPIKSKPNIPLTSALALCSNAQKRRNFSFKNKVRPFYTVQLHTTFSKPNRQRKRNIHERLPPSCHFPLLPPDGCHSDREPPGSLSPSPQSHRQTCRSRKENWDAMMRRWWRTQAEQTCPLLIQTDIEANEVCSHVISMAEEQLQQQEIIASRTAL